MIKKVRKAVFPVAGLGTRFLPATKSMPKEMLPVVDKPLIQYAVEEAVEAGIEEIIFVTGRGKTALEDHFDRSYELEHTLANNQRDELLDVITNILPPHVRVTYTRQGRPLGLGHAVWCAHSIVGDEPFAVLLADDVFKCDTPCLKQMVEAYNTVGGNMVAVTKAPKEDISKYGVIFPGDVDGRMVEIKGMVEKPNPQEAPSNIVISGRYILQPEIFTYLSKKTVGSGGEIQLTDAMERLVATQKFYGYSYDGDRFDCGSKAGWLEANIAFAMERLDLKEITHNVLKKYFKE